MAELRTKAVIEDENLQVRAVLGLDKDATLDEVLAAAGSRATDKVRDLTDEVRRRDENLHDLARAWDLDVPEDALVNGRLAPGWRTSVVEMLVDLGRDRLRKAVNLPENVAENWWATLCEVMGVEPGSQASAVIESVKFQRDRLKVATMAFDQLVETLGARPDATWADLVERVANRASAHGTRVRAALGLNPTAGEDTVLARVAALSATARPAVELKDMATLDRERQERMAALDNVMEMTRRYETSFRHVHELTWLADWVLEGPAGELETQTEAGEPEQQAESGSPELCG